MFGLFLSIGNSQPHQACKLQNPTDVRVRELVGLDYNVCVF